MAGGVVVASTYINFFLTFKLVAISIQYMDNRYHIHNELLNRILILLHSNKLGRFWSNPTGAVKTTKGHFQRYGLKGSSDIIGISNSGRFVAVEIKTGTGRQSKHQLAFQRMIESNGGIYLVIRSEEEFDKLKLLLI